MHVPIICVVSNKLGVFIVVWFSKGLCLELNIGCIIYNSDYHLETMNFFDGLLFTWWLIDLLFNIWCEILHNSEYLFI